MGTHPIFESDFDCLTVMKLLLLIASLVAAQTNGTETTAVPVPDVTTAVPPTPDTTKTTTTKSTTTTTTTTTTSTTKATTTKTPIEPIPTGDDGIVRITRDNETCAMIKFEGSFALDTAEGSISSNSSALMLESTCEKAIILTNDALLTLEFNYTTEVNGNQNVTIWDIMAVGFEYDSVSYNGQVEGMEAHAGSSYSCQTGFNVTLTTPEATNSTFTLELTRVRIQYAVESIAKINNDEFAKAESCAADMEQSLLVPIVVACALAGLVLAICVAYIIGRRRTYSGYAAM